MFLRGEIEPTQAKTSKKFLLLKVYKILQTKPFQTNKKQSSLSHLCPDIFSEESTHHFVRPLYLGLQHMYSRIQQQDRLNSRF
jgi:hypothetical protein